MKTLLISILFTVSAFAGTYDDLYSLSGKENTNTTQAEQVSYINDRFIEIDRFDKLDYSDDELSEESQQYLNKIVEIINSYKSADRNISISVIGHSNENLDSQKALEMSALFASDVAKQLQDNGIDKEMIVVESRGSKDKTSLLPSCEDNRVMVAMYELAPPDKDSDGDGVLDSVDSCTDTPEGAQINEFGCPLDLDKDGVADFQDECLDTPIGSPVDKVGCPFDSDSDGVVDHNDECPKTPKGFSVDASGCPISTLLKLTFERRSSKIKKESYYKVVEFADFMNDNAKYTAKIIGHTDSVGKAATNMSLSFERANVVKASLVKEGVSTNRLQAIGRGELDPIASNRDIEGRATNRRIEVKLFK